MNCHNCGGELEKINPSTFPDLKDGGLLRVDTDLPLKVRQSSIIIFKKLPVLQCENCNEYLIEDTVVEKIDSIFDRIDTKAELEILNYDV